MSLSRLIPARPEDVAATSPKEIKKGILRSSFLRAPLPSKIRAGFQPLGSGPHYERGVAIIAQFSTEILCKIIGYLDPIWVFQLEAAYPEVRDFLINPAANSIWYNALPGAIMTLPDSFQIEFEVSKAQNKEIWNGSVAERYTWSQRRIPRHGSMTETTSSHQQRGDAFGRDMILPEITNISALSSAVEFTDDTRHPDRDLHYPVIKPKSSAPRKRNLALGGPYECHINYRRELLGHAHGGHRCYVCYESFRGGPTRQIKTRFGLQLCAECYACLTVPDFKILEIPGLYHTIHRSRHHDRIWSADRLVGCKVAGFWLAQVDDIVRRVTGIDYLTAIRKQDYLKYLLDIKPHHWASPKRELRNRIVAVAEELWEANDNLAGDPAEIEHMRNSYAPVKSLKSFLFPPRLLCEKAAYDPTHVAPTLHGQWLPDPTDSLINPTQVQACIASNTWISSQARLMLRSLVSDKNNVSMLCSAATDYHIRRIKASLVPEKLMHEAIAGTIQAGGATMSSQRLFVILSKLHLVPDNVTNGISLTAKGEALARAAFPRLIDSACISCPRTHLNVSRGVAAVVNHMKNVHKRTFWKLDWHILA